MNEVGRPIKRVDDPDVVSACIAVRGARLFGQDAVVGVGGEQGFDDDALAVLVYFGHKVVHLLL